METLERPRTMPRQLCPSSSVETQWNKVQWNLSLYASCTQRQGSSSGKLRFQQEGVCGEQESSIHKSTWGILSQEWQLALSATGSQCSSLKIRMLSWKWQDLFWSLTVKDTHLFSSTSVTLCPTLPLWQMFEKGPHCKVFERTYCKTLVGRVYFGKWLNERQRPARCKCKRLIGPTRRGLPASEGEATLNKEVLGFL